MTKTIEDIDVAAKGKDSQKTLQVSVYTTAGAYPESGSSEEKLKEKVEKFLKEAKKALRLTGTDDWELEIDGQIINPALSFEQNHLSGKVKMHWGPPSGGGGC